MKKSRIAGIVAKEPVAVEENYMDEEQMTKTTASKKSKIASKKKAAPQVQEEPIEEPEDVVVTKKANPAKKVGATKSKATKQPVAPVVNNDVHDYEDYMNEQDYGYQNNEETTVSSKVTLKQTVTSNNKGKVAIVAPGVKTTQSKAVANKEQVIEEEEEDNEVVEYNSKVKSATINQKTTKTTTAKSKTAKAQSVRPEPEEDFDEDIEPPKPLSKTVKKTATKPAAKSKQPVQPPPEEEEEEYIEPPPKVVSKKTAAKPKPKPEPVEEEEDYVQVVEEKPKKAVKAADPKTKKIAIGRKEVRTEVEEPIPEPATNQIYLGVINKKIDFNDDEQVEKAQNHIKNVFATKKDEGGDKKLTETDKQNFKDFVSKINNVQYTGYDYSIVPEQDYFKNFEGKLVETILNSEDAAIKKCEEIWSKLGEDEKYWDKDFGSLLDDKGVKNKQSLYFNGTPGKGAVDPNLVEWYRLGEISMDEPARFIDDGVESNDVMQGALGDCWFISALSVLATKDHLLRGEFNNDAFTDGHIDDEDNVMVSTGVYPPLFHGFRRKNIFVFRFFKNFKWRYVIIDDRLPCKKVFNNSQAPKLLYGKCRNESEFWVPLIEKAYAKLHGCYEALISGFIDDGLVDLTGLVARKMTIAQEDTKPGPKSDALWELLKNCSSFDFKEADTSIQKRKAKILTRNNTMMGCSIDAKVVESEVIFENHKSGVLAGHAYAILDAFEIKKPNSKKSRKTSRLLRIRNPWGYKEWNGKWSDESEEITNNKEKIQQALDKKYTNTNEKIVLDAEDGTFIICFSDFRMLFTKLFICIDFPPNVIGIRFLDSWSKEQSGGLPINNTDKELKSWSKNPQFYLKLTKKSNVYISLQQNDGRMSKSKFPYAEHTRKACLIIMKTSGQNRMTCFDNNQAVEISPVRHHRENSLQRELDAGEYLIIPSILKEGEIGDFCLEIFLPDSIKKGKFTRVTDSLTSSTLVKLGTPAKVELIEDGQFIDIHEAREVKSNFIYSQFLNILKDTDDSSYKDKKSGDNKKTDSKAQGRSKKKNTVVEEEEYY